MVAVQDGVETIMVAQAKAGEVVLFCNTKAEARSRDVENVLCVEPNPLSVYTHTQKVNAVVEERSSRRSRQAEIL
jgi:hypothetical protein